LDHEARRELDWRWFDVEKDQKRTMKKSADTQVIEAILSHMKGCETCTKAIAIDVKSSPACAEYQRLMTITKQAIRKAFAKKLNPQQTKLELEVEAKIRAELTRLPLARRELMLASIIANRLHND
jgi:hypothetical protein